MELTSIDLFAGIGGIRLGTEQAGIKTVYANDFDKYCKVTYDLNFSDPKLDCENIWDIVDKPLPNFNMIAGGFPCQGFSIAGYRHGFSDVKGRGNLFFSIAKLIDKYRPVCFLLENVKNLVSHDSGKTFATIRNTIENDLNYKLHWKVMNSLEYGNVPQTRERIYLVGFREEEPFKKFSFPEPIPLSKSLKLDILSNPESVDEIYYYNGKPLYERIKDEIMENKVYQWRRIYVRQNKKDVIPTLTANMGMGGHNVPIIRDSRGIRKLTPLECAKAQGFPEDYKFPKNIPISQLYKQIGNSVTVPVIKRISDNILLALGD